MKKLLFTLLLSMSLQGFAQKIPFKTLPSGHIMVTAVIEGTEGNFILDTGAGINLFFTDFASKLPQKPSSYNFLTGFRATGERMDIPLFRSREITFGGHSFRNIPFSTADMKLPGIDGLISLKMFEQQDILIDYTRQEISLTDAAPASYPKSIDIFLSTQQDDTLDIFTWVTLNSTYKIKVLLDSGAGSKSFWLSTRLLSTLNADPKSMQSIEKKSEFNKSVKTTIYKGNIDLISNEYATIKKPDITFVENLIYDGKTGIDWLGKKFVISIKNRKIYILE